MSWRTLTSESTWGRLLPVGIFIVLLAIAIVVLTHMPGGLPGPY